MSGRHPRRKLNDIIHSPVRLSVMAVLAAITEADFKYVREIVQVSDSLLSKHLAVLQAAEYLRIRKGVVQNRPITWLSLTETGTAAYRDYLGTLDQIIGRGKEGHTDAD